MAQMRNNPEPAPAGFGALVDQYSNLTKPHFILQVPLLWQAYRQAVPDHTPINRGRRGKHGSETQAGFQLEVCHD